MMLYNEIREIVYAKPFRPFRLHIADGTVREVRHLERFLLTQAYMAVALPVDPNDSEPNFTRLTIVDLFHITQIDPLSSPGMSEGRV